MGSSGAIPDLSTLPDNVRVVVEQAFGNAIADLFLVAAPVALVSLIAVLFLKEVPLGNRSGIEQLLEQEGAMLAPADLGRDRAVDGRARRRSTRRGSEVTARGLTHAARQRRRRPAPVAGRAVGASVRAARRGEVRVEPAELVGQRLDLGSRPPGQRAVQERAPRLPARSRSGAGPRP